MANSRYDDIKYYDNGEFKIPQEVKVFDGTNFVSLGAKDSFNTNKLCAFDGSNMFCATYRRNDVDIPGTIQIGKNKYLEVQKKESGKWKWSSVNTYNSGYYFEMRLSVTEDTALYTAFSKDNGDINLYSYVNYVAKVKDGKVALYIYSIYKGKSISTGKQVSQSGSKTTSYCVNVGETFTIKLTRSSNSGKLRRRIINSAGTTVYDDSSWDDATMTVGNPNHHYIGMETTDGTGKKKSYGNAKISYISFTPVSDRNKEFNVAIENKSNGTTTIECTGGYTGRVNASGTSVYRAQYTEYLKQTI